MITLKDKNIVIIGAEKTGRALCKVLSSLAANIMLVDKKKEHELKEPLSELKKLKIKLCLGRQDKEILNSADLVVISPGVPLNEEILNIARRKKIEVTGEVELAFKLFPHPNIIAITGTDGKTTTTTLTYEIFKNAQRKAKLAGNIGFPLIEVLKNSSFDTYVIAEISSFQLETTETFKPKISVIINIAEDHLDRHKTMENYINAKSKIFINQDMNNFTVLNYDNEITKNLQSKTKANVIFFSQEHFIDRGVFVKNKKIISNIFGEEKEIIETDEIKIKGRHNIENSLAAIATAILCKINVEKITETLKNFSGVAHRQEFVDEYRGIKFINDSKATTPNATIAAIRAFEQPIILIAGGRSKGANWSILAAEIANKVKKIILIGESRNEIANIVSEYKYYNFILAKNLEEAVYIAFDNAKEGDIILLSPACSSLDQFIDYEHRGEEFKKIIKKLKEEYG